MIIQNVSSGAFWYAATIEKALSLFFTLDGKLPSCLFYFFAFYYIIVIVSNIIIFCSCNFPTFSAFHYVHYRYHTPTLSEGILMCH